MVTKCMVIFALFILSCNPWALLWAQSPPPPTVSTPPPNTPTVATPTVSENPVTSMGSTASIPTEQSLRDRLTSIVQEAIVREIQALREDVVTAGRDAVDDSRSLTSDDLQALQSIPKDVVARLEGRKKAIRDMILETAKAIEEGQPANIEVNEQGFQHSSRVAERMRQLSAAFRENRISLNSLALAIQSIVTISKTLYERALNEKDPARKMTLYLDYTAFVYEMSGIVLDKLNEFEQGGVATIKAIYNERKESVERIKKRMEERLASHKKRLQQDNIDQTDYQARDNRYADFNKALDASLNAWNDVFAMIDEQGEWVKTVKQRAQQFAELKADAALQLDILVEIGIARDMLDHLRGIEQLARLDPPQLLVLDEEVARRLMGLDIPRDIESSPVNVPR